VTCRIVTTDIAPIRLSVILINPYRSIQRQLCCFCLGNVLLTACHSRVTVAISLTDRIQKVMAIRTRRTGHTFEWHESMFL